MKHQITVDHSIDYTGGSADLSINIRTNPNTSSLMTPDELTNVMYEAVSLIEEKFKSKALIVKGDGMEVGKEVITEIPASVEIVAEPSSQPQPLPLPPLTKSDWSLIILNPNIIYSHGSFSVEMINTPAHSGDIFASILGGSSKDVNTRLEYITSRMVIESNVDCEGFLIGTLKTIPLLRFKFVIDTAMALHPLLNAFIRGGTNLAVMQIIKNRGFYSELDYLIESHSMMSSQFNMEVFNVFVNDYHHDRIIKLLSNAKSLFYPITTTNTLITEIIAIINNSSSHSTDSKNSILASLLEK